MGPSHWRLKPLSIYDFTVVTIDNANINLKIYKGKVLLIINMGRKSMHYR